MASVDSGSVAEAAGPVADEIESIASCGEPVHRVFDDFLDLVLAVLERDPGRKADIYDQYERDYGSRPEVGERFPTALEKLLTGYNRAEADVIGAVYEQLELENDHIGQYFTPTELVALTSTLVGSDDAGRVHDPACGSGRFLVQRAVEDGGDGLYTGIDRSETAAKMAVINLAVLNVEGHIWQGDSLTREMFQRWAILPTPMHLGLVNNVSLGRGE